MASKYLSSLSKNEYQKLTKKLWSIQNQKCFICEEEINLNLHSTNIDHIVPLANKGEDSEENFALTHESCNKSKQDANLKIAKVLAKLKKIQDKIHETENKTASLKDVLLSFGGSKYDFNTPSKMILWNIVFQILVITLFIKHKFLQIIYQKKKPVLLNCL